MGRMALNINFGYWAIGGCITNVLTPNAGAKAQSHFNLIPGLKAGAPTLYGLITAEVIPVATIKRARRPRKVVSLYFSLT